MNKITTNTFEMECKLREAKARVETIAKSGISFEEYERTVKSDKRITSLVPNRVLNIIIKKYSHLPL